LPPKRQRPPRWGPLGRGRLRREARVMQGQALVTRPRARAASHAFTSFHRFDGPFVRCLSNGVMPAPAAPTDGTAVGVSCLARVARLTASGSSGLSLGIGHHQTRRESRPRRLARSLVGMPRTSRSIRSPPNLRKKPGHRCSDCDVPRSVSGGIDVQPQARRHPLSFKGD